MEQAYTQHIVGALLTRGRILGVGIHTMVGMETGLIITVGEAMEFIPGIIIQIMDTTMIGSVTTVDTTMATGMATTMVSMHLIITITAMIKTVIIMVTEAVQV